MKRYISAAVVATFLSSAAIAGNPEPHLDEPEVIAPLPERFEGFNLVVGYGIAGNADLRFNSESSDNVTKDAFLAFDMKARTRVEAGYRWQANRNVYGLSVTGVMDFGNDTFSCDNVSYLCQGGVTSGIIVAGSYGRTFGKTDSVLVYGKAGVALVKGSLWHKRLANGQEWQKSFTDVGPVVGVGVQKVFDSGFLVGVEASWIFAGKETWDINVWGPHDHRLETSGSIYTLSANIGWQF